MISRLQKPHRLWFAVFAYSLVAFYVMRAYITPAFGHSESGHLKGDPLYYHQVATALAEKIRQQGISEWVLHAEGQGPAGIFALMYLISDSSLGIILLNSTLHATSSVL